MSIRSKLLGIVIGLAVLVGASFGLFLALQLPIKAMEKERSVIYDYEAAVLQLQVQTNCILTRPTGVQLEIFQEAIKRHNEVFDRLQALQSLPRASKESAQVFKSTIALQSLYYAYVSNIFQKMTEAYEIYKPAMEGHAVKIMVDLRDRSDVDTFGMLPYLIKIQSERDNSYSALDLASKKAQVLIDTAGKEIAAASLRAMLLSVILVLAATVAGVALVATLVRRMAVSISAIQKAIATMAEGRIGRVLPDLGKDELGAVSRDMNRLNGMMAAALSGIKASAARNGENAGRLGGSVMEFSSSAYQIEKNAEMIGQRMEKVDRLAEKAAKDMDSISSAIAALDKGIENQSALVADSGAAVTQMLASLENIARITEADSKEADELAVKAEQGMSVVDETFSSVAEIGSSVDDIQEMVQIISDIAGQTNLLAMNAEIEAAHAGEAGKGFSVVAGEIRNLAEAAGNSSREIDARTRVIIDTIEKASSTRDASVGALKEVIERIQAVARSVGEIYSSVAEIRAGSRQIQESVEALRGESEAIGRESGSVSARAESTRGSVSELGLISHETSAGVAEMGNGLGLVSRSLKELGAMVEAVAAVGTDLKKASDAFTIEEAGPSAG